MTDPGGRATLQASAAPGGTVAARWWIPVALIVPTTLFVFLQVNTPSPGDVPLYRTIGAAMLRGTPLYTVQPVEYPPYVVLWWVLPALTGSLHTFMIAFGLELAALDAAVKVLLLREGRRFSRNAAAYGPFAVFVVASLAQDYIYMKRFDLIPAAMTFFGAVCLVRSRPFLSGLLFAAAIGTKLYPIIMVPVLCAVAWRRGQLSRFIAGGVSGLLPLGLLSWVMPWWRFLAAHTGRGLQAESLYAGVIWLAHLAGAPAEWANTAAYTEVRCPLALTVEPMAQVLWASTVVVSVIVAARDAGRAREQEIGDLARMLLLPLVAFVGFNFVLSPQYMMWLMGFVALASTRGWTWPLAGLVLACLLSPIVYPTATYTSGFDLPHAFVLCTRNLLLVTAWGGLLVEMVRGAPLTPAAPERE